MNISKKTLSVLPVILCGGSGTRLWPLSRSGFPKQFLSITGEDSLLQKTAKRLMSLSTTELSIQHPLIVTGEEHRFLAAEQMRELNISPSAILLEPMAKNTAPALTLAALEAIRLNQDPVLVVTPADQTVDSDVDFTKSILKAISEAEHNNIMILGVTPTYPETGYGYIQILLQNVSEEVHLVKRFVEKPNAATAQQYLANGDHYWNAGIFVLKASVWLKTLKKFRPDILETTSKAWQKRTIDSNFSTSFIRPSKAEFAAIPNESIDYAVMENCPSSSQSIKMVPLNAGWSDLGAWDAVWKTLPKDCFGSSLVGDVLQTGSTNNLVHTTSRLVSLVGVSNLVVIETPDAVMIANKANCQDVKNIVKQLSDQKREEHVSHRKVHRPWGWFDSIDEGDRFKVKRIRVNPKASLSLQKHHHRAEHWIVVTGTAEIINGNKKQILTENQSTYIPLGEVHRLSNPGNTPLEIIEVQSGIYLGEDDIVRFEDTYGRID